MEWILDPAVIWFVAGVVLALLEMAAPGFILIFFGGGAWVVSLTTVLGLTPTLAAQLAVFGGSSVALLLTTRRFIKNRFTGDKSSTRDSSSDLDEFTGKAAKVLTRIHPGSRDGRVEFKGAPWTALSDETLEEGEIAQIIEAEGTVLRVRKTSPAQEDS